MAEIPYGRLHALETVLGGRAAIQKAIDSGGPDATRQSLMAGSDGSLQWDGVPRVISRSFDHATPGLDVGHAVWTPNPGDLLFDAWFEIDTAWNGTTPLGDLGAFEANNTTGWIASVWLPVDMTVEDIDFETADGLLGQFGPITTSRGLMAAFMIQAAERQAAGGGANWQMPPAGRFTAANPVKVVVSQTGLSGGGATNATVGSATLYLMVATPASA